MDVLFETKRSLRGDLQAKRKEAKEAADQIEKLEAKVVEASAGLEERDRLQVLLEKVEAERDRLKEEKKKMEEELPKKLKEVGGAGYNEAGEYYQKQVEDLVRKAFRDWGAERDKGHPRPAFLRDYQVGLNYADVPEVDHRREPPVVPPVELPEHLLPAEQPYSDSDKQPDPISDSAEA